MNDTWTFANRFQTTYTTHKVRIADGGGKAMLQLDAVLSGRVEGAAT